MGKPFVPRIHKEILSKIHVHLRKVGLLLARRNTCLLGNQVLRTVRCWQRRLTPWISRVERRAVVALPRSGPGRLAHRNSCWGLPANLSRAPASWQPDSDPAGVQYIWTADTRRGKIVEARV
jgi:hypothetical protein